MGHASKCTQLVTEPAWQGGPRLQSQDLTEGWGQENSGESQEWGNWGVHQGVNHRTEQPPKVCTKAAGLTPVAVPSALWEEPSASPGGSRLGSDLDLGTEHCASSSAASLSFAQGT